MRRRRCPTCHTSFEPKNGNHKYCRPQCNPRVSKIDKYRKELLERESPRYVVLQDLMKTHNVKFEFEYVLGPFIYDLALPGPKILVEFQGTGHLQPNLQIRDYKKAWEAQLHGWSCIWVAVDRGGVIPVDWLKKILNWRC